MAVNAGELNGTRGASPVAMLAPMSYDDDRMATKKKPEPVERGGASANPSEEYFEALGLTRLHIRLPTKDYDRLVKLADAAFPPTGDRHQLRAYISQLIEEKWQQRKR